MKDEESVQSTYIETRWGRTEVYREDNFLVFDYPDRVDEKKVELPSSLSIRLENNRINYSRVEEGFVGDKGVTGRTEKQLDEAKESNQALQEIVKALDVGGEWMR